MNQPKIKPNIWPKLELIQIQTDSNLYQSRMELNMHVAQVGLKLIRIHINLNLNRLKLELI